MTAKSKLLGSVMKGYLYRNAARDARKLIKHAKDVDYEKLLRQIELKKLVKAARNLDLDRERIRLLHRVGLTDYSPGKATFASLGLVAFGALAGGVAALAMAPKKGEELRSEVKERAQTLFHRASERSSEFAQA
jgi:hypothetical protein